VLHAREYADENERTYAYHWQDEENQLRTRWDNAPHHIQDRIGALKDEGTVAPIRVPLRLWTEQKRRASEGQTRSLRPASRIDIIAHCLSTVRNADRVYVLDKGQVIERDLRGTPDALKIALPHRRSGSASIRAGEDGKLRKMVQMQSL